ncbi:hypothetical protein [Alteromonas sp. BMJM2]|uniref:hypothetical protein n=1 Tax=Alteromonas sp. BMJM2 TaxID=2954241 RepID=UPI0022B539C6|nr:hypothetical protein [Alteromonas sp. BMJM2]
MPNSFAYIALLAWPLLALLFYRRFDALTASFITIVGGYMFLPAATVIDPPLLPAMGKDQIAGVSALIGCLFIKRLQIHYFGRTNLQKFLILFLTAIPFINMFFNTEPVFDGEKFNPGLTPYDSIASVIAQYLFLLPYIIGISVVSSSKDVTKLINLLVSAGLIYSIFALVEIRLSPQLHTWIYGFFPHSFAQQVRMGGFRPVVFMGHGLLVAMFFMCCASLAFIKARYMRSSRPTLDYSVFAFITVVLLLCKTVSAFIWLLVFFAIFFIARYISTKVFWALFFVFLAYPLLSIVGFIPYESILEIASSFSEDKYGSLKLRFMNEIQLLAHTQEKWFIGWGGWNRNRLHDSVTDGYWIIAYSKYGFFYFAAIFSLFVAPALNGFTSFSNSLTLNLKLFISLIILSVVVMFDQLINSSLGHSWLWLIAGLTAELIRKQSFEYNRNRYQQDCKTSKLGEGA